ncbi:MAG: hypothetical protein AAGA50_16690 [Pseudomonadota bacterium]
MASLEDITGWRDELRQLEENEEYMDQRSEKFMDALELKTPLSDVLKFMEIVAGDEELRDAVEQSAVWDKVIMATEGGMHRTHPRYSECPHEALGTLRKFNDWYCWKGGYEPVSAFDLAGFGTLMDVLDGRLPAIRSAETINYILQEYGEWVKPVQEVRSDD